MELDEEVASQDQVQMADILTCSLPTSRVKKICRLDPDLAMIGSDAILFLTKAAVSSSDYLQNACKSLKVFPNDSVALAGLCW